MYVTGCHTGLAQLVCQRQDGAVVIPQLLLILCRTIGNEEFVVANRLDFQIIIKIRNTQQFFPGGPAQHGGKQLARFTGGTENQAFPVANQLAPGHNRFFIKIFQVGIGNQLVEIFQANLIFCQNNEMIPAEIFQAAGLGLQTRQQRVDVGNLLRMQFLPQLVQQLDENTSQYCRIFTGSVVVKGSYLECLCHAVQPVAFHIREQDFGHFHGINGSEVPLDAKALTAFVDKRHVKARIMCHQRQIPGKIQKSRQRLG